MNELYLIDVSGWIFRAYYAIPEMTNPAGESTNALFGFIRSLLKLLKDFEPTHVAAVFDGPDGKKSRKQIYADYKAHRGAAPADLPKQIERAAEFCKLLGVPQLAVPGVEADDTMGTIAHHKGKGETHVYLCTSDKDLAQLVNENVTLLNTHKENLMLDPKKVEEVYGVPPSKIIDFLAIMGDSSDNIPGLPGFGPKTAISLLSEFGTLEKILAHPEKVKGEKKQETLVQEADTALLSQKLATIHLDVDCPKDDSFYQLSAPDTEGLANFYREMGFNSLLKEKTKQSAPADYSIVDTPEELQALVDQLLKEEELAFDTETTALRPLLAGLVGIGFSNGEGNGWYIPANGKLGKAAVLKGVAPLFSKVGMFAHNAKYDAHILANDGIEIANICWDTLIASYLLNAHERQHNLDHLALHYFEKVKIPIKSLLGTGKKAITMNEVPIEKVAAYCAEDVDTTWQLKEVLSKELKERGLEKVFFDIEMPLLPILVEMERTGMYVDREALEKMSIKLSAAIKQLEEEIHRLAGRAFKVSSPKQLSEVLFDEMGIKPPKRTATGYSTNAEVLEKLAEDHPIATKVLEYRSLEKLRGTYVDALPNEINPKTGRIHPTFNQLGAATGRLSCQDPNLQNIPVRTELGKEIRAAFKPQDTGWLYLSADYSQIELRLLAHLSGEPKLLEAFEQGADIHAATAATVFNVPLKEVSRDQRHHAKAVNFGILYGQQAFGLSQGLGIPMKEASIFISAYFEHYPKVKSFLEGRKEEARKSGRAVTMMGRERLIPEIGNKNPMIRGGAERLAINTPLQGSAADLIKIAMIRMDRWLKEKKLKSKMILQIHDELIFEAPKEEIEPLREGVVEIMEGAMELSIPLVVDVGVGKNWKEC